MLAKQFRLPITISLAGTPLFSDNSLSVKVQKNNLPNSRFGFVVGKGVDKRAVVRNRIKRSVRSLIEEKYLHVPGLDMLFILRAGSKSLTRKDFEERLTKIFEKI